MPDVGRMPSRSGPACEAADLRPLRCARGVSGVTASALRSSPHVSTSRSTLSDLIARQPRPLLPPSPAESGDVVWIACSVARMSSCPPSHQGPPPFSADTLSSSARRSCWRRIPWGELGTRLFIPQFPRGVGLTGDSRLGLQARCRAHQVDAACGEARRCC